MAALGATPLGKSLTTLSLTAILLHDAVVGWIGQGTLWKIQRCTVHPFLFLASVLMCRRQSYPAQPSGELLNTEVDLRPNVECQPWRASMRLISLTIRISSGSITSPPSRVA